MVAEHAVKPRLVEQRERLFRLRAAIDQIADRKQPVARRIERDFVQQITQRIDAPVQIANDKVATGAVACVMANVSDECVVHGTIIVRCATRVCGVSIVSVARKRQHVPG